MKKLQALLLLLLTLSSTLGVSQSSEEFKVNFSQITLNKDTAIRSGFIEIQNEANNCPFIGISAYTAKTAKAEHLFFRTSNDSETWSDWRTMSQDNEFILEDRKVYEGRPILKSFKFIQFRIEKVENQLFTFRLFFPYKLSKQIDKTKSNASCACNQPAYCQRSCWCPNGSCPEDLTPTTTSPSHVIVHHSAGFNTSNDFAAVVAYYWDLHVNTNGWDDIGYNWLIDPNGVIYEGRGDGIRGAHFSCMNENTTGICMIGNFQNQAPTSASISELKNLIAWEACDKNILPNTLGYHNSSQLNLEHISGHKDGNNASVGCPSGTACPGTFLYNELQNIRLAVDSFACLQGVDLIEGRALTSFSFSLYPNPASETLSLELSFAKVKNYTLEILNVEGKVIFEETKKVEQQHLHKKIDVSNFPKGVYVVRLGSLDQTLSKKFTVL